MDPRSGELPRARAEGADLDPDALGAAAALALADEPELPREMRGWLARTLAEEPWPYVLGPVRDRAGPTGLVVVNGREVLRWGDPDAPDMAFSIAKSALATVAGLAFDDGLLEDLDAPVGERLALEPLAGTPITWRHLLTQTSDWRGTVFGVPWWADPQGRQAAGDPPLGPGRRFAYNDVRTNLLSLALTHLHGASCGTVLGERILAPIGVPEGWSWHGLDGMRTRLANGREVPVVTGGSHWGGGLWLSAHDLARFALLHLGGGRWAGRRLLSERWCTLMLEPCLLRPAYGLMWWRNPDGAQYPGCDPAGFCAHGTGEQVVWCDRRRELVAVVRWARDPAAILAAITAAVPVRHA